MNIRLTMLALCFVGIVDALKAEDFCVSSAFELQKALWQAQSNGQDNHIKIVRGVYRTVDGLGLNLGFQYTNSMPYDLIISGGWQSTPDGSNCLRRGPVAAYETALTGTGIHRVLQIAAGDSDANVTVSNLSIQSGFPYTVNGDTGGLYIRGGGVTDFASDVLIDRVAFIGNEGQNSAALLIQSTGRVQVRNSLFRNNTVNDLYTASIESFSDKTAYFTNNTVVNNQTLTGNGISGVFLRNFGAGGSVAANNVMWNNDMWDFFFLGGNSTNHHLLNNIVQNVTGNTGIDLGNSDTNPLLDTDFSLTFLSPAIDTGLAPLQNQINPPPELDWFVGEYDLLGYRREMGLTVDRGAVELIDVIFKDGFD